MASFFTSCYSLHNFLHMKTILISFLPAFFCFAQHTAAQAQITGQFLDVSNQPIVGATVLLQHAADSSLIKGHIADVGGRFVFDNLAEGRYFIAASMIGYADFSSEPFLLESASGLKDLGALTLLENNALLDEAVVVAKRPFLEQKIDRMVVNVANSITSAGSNALEVLQRSPGVQVNRLTKAISLLGKEGVVVMINGKISRQPADAVIQMLEGMNADNIDRIELIHTPPANFEAEGNAGIINIVLKSSGDEGLNGGYSAKAGYGRGEKYGAGLHFNYRKNKVNWFGNYDYNFDLNPQVFTNYRGVRQGGDFLETDSQSDRPHTPTALQNAQLGADFQIAKKTMLGVLGTFFDRDWYMEAVNDVTYSRNGAVETQIRMPNTEINRARSFAGNINLAHQFSKNQSLNLDADLIWYDINNPSDYDIQERQDDGSFAPLYQLRIGKKTPIRVAVAKADYSINIGKSLKLEMGGKIISMRFDNDVRVDSLSYQQDWLVLPAYTSLSHLNEDVEAAYATFSSKISDKTDLKAGLRYEYTNTNLSSAERPNIVDRHYGSWFPSVFITHQLTEKQSLNFSYSRRITRPQISQLAPWLIFTDPTTLLGGNPELQPSFTSALKLDYGFKSWRLGLAYSREDSPIRPVPRVDPETNRQVNGPENLDNQLVASVDLRFPLHPAKWWEVQNSLFANSTETNFELEGKKLRVQNLNYGFNTNHSFTLPKQFTLELSGNYNSPGYWGVIKWRATGSADVGIQKDFGEKWGKLRFSASDLFRSTNWYGSTNQPDINLLVDVSFRFAQRTFMLSWTNTFGNKKLKSARERQTGSAEEMRRI